MYGFAWYDKGICKSATNLETKGTLRPCKEESVNFDNTENLYIEGDNLEVLKLLQKSYYGKIKMIYIDPPYNTGNDFVYKDNFKDNLQNYLELTGQVDGEGKRISANQETAGRYHSNWLNMMYPRLFLARNLLKDDGVIFVSIDDNEVAQLKLLMDEIFGEENFRGTIIRATGTTTGQEALKIGSSYDSCLCYSKTVYFQLKGIPLKGKDLNRFNNDDNDGKGKFALLQLRKTGNADRKEDREGMFFSITAPDGSEVFPIGPTDYLGRWRTGKDKYKKFIEDGLIVWKENGEDVEEIDDEENENLDDEKTDYLTLTNENVDIAKYKSKWKPYVKYYLSERTKKVSNLWTDVDGNKKGSIELKELFDKKKIFENPKPTDFIKLLITISCNYNDIILDFFAGSGTTGDAVMQLNSEDDGGNRKYIMVQLPETTDEKSEAYKAGYKNICEIGKERIRRAGNKILEELKEKNKQLKLEEESKKINLDTGFKVLKLDTSNFKEWDNNPNNLEQQLFNLKENIKEERTQDDILYEIILKSGLSLTEKFELPEIQL